MGTAGVGFAMVRAPGVKDGEVWGTAGRRLPQHAPKTSIHLLRVIFAQGLKHDRKAVQAPGLEWLLQGLDSKPSQGVLGSHYLPRFPSPPFFLFPA